MNPITFAAVAALGAATIRLATPLTLAALGGILSERSGVVNIALEGMMLGAAWGAVTVAKATGNAWAGLVAGIVIGGLIGLLHAVFTQALRVPHILSGVAINLGVLGLTTFLLRLSPTGLEAGAQLPGELMVVLALILIGLVTGYLFRTAGGLRLRACGENPKAARSSGVSVTRTRYTAVVASGMFAGLGGVALSLSGLGAFTENMTAGRGYIALAAVIFGRWHPLWATIAALLFGFGDALQLYLQTQGVTAIPPDFLTLLPYILTLTALLLQRGRSIAPAALGDTDA